MCIPLRPASACKISLSSRAAVGEPSRAEPRRYMASATAVSPPPPLLLLTLLACATAAAGYSVCDRANCGYGNCTEVPGLFPYECQCKPGWSQGIKFLPISPCTIPNCTFDSACFNLSLGPPRGIPITDICVAVNCGPGGTCKDGSVPFSYTCECQPGYVNVLNLTALPCVKNCAFGMDCAALGLGPQASPPGGHDHDASGAPASPPPGPKGSVSLWSLLQLLLLVSMAMVRVL